MAEVSLGLSLGITHGRVITELDRPDDLAAGVPYVYTVQGGYWELPRSLSFSFSAGADDTVADVQVAVVDDTDTPVAIVDTGAAVAADTTALYTFLWNWSGAAAWSNDTVNAALPQILIQPTWSLQVVVLGGWTEGQITTIRYYRERFITGPGGYEIGVQWDEDAEAARTQQIVDRLS